MKNHHYILDDLLEGCQVIGFDWRYLYVNDAVAGHGHKPKAELLGRTIMEAYPGIENTDVFAVLRRCMDERAPCDMENEFAYPDGATAWFELRIRPVPEGVFVLSIDVTARKHAEQETERQLYRLKSLRAIDLAILGTTDLQLALKAVLQEAVNRLQVDAATIFLFNPTTLKLDVAASIGFRSHVVGPIGLSLGEGVAGKAALERRTIVVPDLAKSTPFAGVPAAVLQEEGAQALCAVPLIAKGQLVGALRIVHRTPLDPDPHWLEFLETLAGQAALAIDMGRSFENLQRSNLDLTLAYDTTIEGWSHALDLRDKETEGHTLRVTDMTLTLARLADMSEAELVHVRRGALLHDIGKMGIPDAILLKPDKLTDEEWVVMRKHPTYAYELLSPIAHLRPALDIPYCHHEKWDGLGYPRGLKGEQIPLAARLFAVVDVWDALRSDRPYRRGWPEEKVREYIRAQTGKHFDPRAVDLFWQAIGEKAHEREQGVGGEPHVRPSSGSRKA